MRAVLALALLGSAAALFPSRQATDAKPILPLPDEPLVVQSTKDKPLSLADLLAFLSRSTGVTFSYEPNVKASLAGTRVELSQYGEVPANEAYAWVEGLLLQNGFKLGILTEGEHPLVGVYATIATFGAGASAPVPVHVRVENAAACADHPALLVQTVVDMGPNVDVRTLGNSLRMLVNDQTGVAILPIGTSQSVVVTGMGRPVASTVALLQDVVRQAEPDRGGNSK